jgi:hypothetical protein
VATLTARKRKKLGKKSYAIPSKKLYPIHDKAHAKNALARAASPKNRGHYATVRKAVLKKYPSLKQTGKRQSVGGKGSVTRSTKRGKSRPSATMRAK